jgi:sigma-B regulation protein RsbU (phosphoserine phosphatase)
MVPGQAPRLVFTSSGRVLGLLPASDITAEALDLVPGATFVLFTDGVSEAFGPDGELLGEERLLTHLHGLAGRNARETAVGVLDAVRTHAAGAQQSDDITVMTIRYAGHS